eukprot:2544970-Rhodomonas_salina.1
MAQGLLRSSAAGNRTTLTPRPRRGRTMHLFNVEQLRRKLRLSSAHLAQSCNRCKDCPSRTLHCPTGRWRGCHNFCPPPGLLKRSRLARSSASESRPSGPGLVAPTIYSIYSYLILLSDEPSPGAGSSIIGAPTLTSTSARTWMPPVIIHKLDDDDDDDDDDDPRPPGPGPGLT